MQLKPLIAIAALAIALPPAAHGESFFSKGIMKLAKVMGKMVASKTSTLDGVVLTVGIGSNLHSDKVEEAAQSFLGNWKSGGDAVTVMFSASANSGFMEIDGQVLIDGKPMDYVTLGTYCKMSEASAAPRKIEVITKSGQKGAFTLQPYKNQVKLLAINGDKAGDAPGAAVPLDLSKDMELELSVPAGMEGSLGKISITVNQLSIKSFVDVIYVPLAAKVVVPAGGFRNLNLKPASTLLYSFKEAYISVGVESVEKATDVSGSFKEVKYTAQYTDGKFIKVTTEPKLNTGLVSKGTDKDAKVQFDFFKANAFLSRPFSQLKSIGLKSFAIRGTTYSKSTSTTETSTTITTTTTTLQFPPQPDSVWAGLLEQLYPDFAAAVEEELGAKIKPVDAVTKTEAYKTLKAFAMDDTNTHVAFSRGYRDTKVTSAFMPVTEGFGNNSVDRRLMDEAGVDGLLTMTLDLTIGSDGKLVLMTPRFGFEISGKLHTPLADTKYCSGTLQSTVGVPSDRKVDMAGLVALIRKDDMLKVLRKGLQDLKAQEKANGDYEPVWNFQFPKEAGALGAR